MNVFGFWTPGPVEIIIVIVILLLLFGPKKIPQLARGLGSSFTEFKKGLRGTEDEAEDVSKEIENNVRQIRDDLKTG